MNKEALKTIIRKLIEEDVDVNPDKQLAINIKEEILDLPHEYNCVIQDLHSLSDVKVLNVSEFPQIATMIKQLYLNDASYEFKKIFDSSNDITFVPSSLEFNSRFIEYLKAHPDEVLIKFVTSSDKEFLIFVSPVRQVEYIWEFVNEVVEEPEEADEADAEEEEAPEEEF
jgi:hypothetical protein